MIQSSAPKRRAALPAVLCILLLASPLLRAQGYPRPPMQPRLEDGAEARWLSKKVLDARPLDSMETLAHWSFKGAGTMTLSSEHTRDGQHSLRLASTDNIARVNGDGEWNDLLATRSFPSEDWSRYNRISLWIYADVAGAPAIPASLTLHNEGAHILPDPYNEGRDESLLLKNHAWTHIVWEIAPLSRDKVTALDIGYSLPKMFPDPGDHTVLYVADLELQTVVPDHVEGWDVAAGKIAFSHAGYPIGATKTAIASNLAASSFSVVENGSGKPVMTKAVKTETTPLGTYQVLDFSALHTPGTYRIRAGSELTQPFIVSDSAWDESVWKDLNFMYSERCGTVIPGIHGICHQDDYTLHDGKRIVVNGGYHDAGDLTATGNITGMTYGLFSYAERLQQQGEDPQLLARLIEEGKWGLAWILKTRFGDGYRSTGQLISYWTNGIMGDADDRFGNAKNDPEWNFRVAADEALAARVLEKNDPELANRSLATARDDWRYAVAGLKAASPLPDVYGAQDELERISFGVIASIDLYRATHEQQYVDEAIALGSLILQSQERHLQPWTVPMTGYFYTGPSRKYLFHRFHIGEEEQPIVALTDLCNAFPDNPEWIRWYSAVVLHSQYYQQRAAALDAPYNVLPAGIYLGSEVSLIPQQAQWRQLRDADRSVYLDQLHKGLHLGGDAYLRRYPIWFNFRGNSSVLLSESKALSVAAHLRGDLAADDLAEQQAQWIIGRNPFSSSIMYGEGYNWTPLYSVRSGQMVGALPVGIETRGNADAPYWPTQICWTYKEVWSQPAGEWIWLMRDLNGPAVVNGTSDAGNRAPIEFLDQRTGVVRRATPGPDAAFRVLLPQGIYTARQGATRTTLTVLSGSTYSVDLRRDHAMDLSATSATAANGEVTLHISATGEGTHHFAVRADNLNIDGPVTQSTQLSPNHPSEIVWHAHLASADSPWVAVIVPDDAIAQRRELTGALPSALASHPAN